jgi:hypothetical protein
MLVVPQAESEPVVKLVCGRAAGGGGGRATLMLGVSVSTPKERVMNKTFAYFPSTFQLLHKCYHTHSTNTRGLPLALNPSAKYCHPYYIPPPGLGLKQTVEIKQSTAVMKGR